MVYVPILSIFSLKSPFFFPGSSSKSKDDMDVFLDSMELLDLVNEYRHQKGLQRIEISPALMAVSFAHVKDLSENTRIPNCNMHSWSNQQPEWWAGCCYTADHAKADCMWSKGKEITSCWGHTKYAICTARVFVKVLFLVLSW